MTALILELSTGYELHQPARKQSSAKRLDE